MLNNLEIAEVPEKAVRITIHDRAKVGGVAAIQLIESNAGSETEKSVWPLTDMKRSCRRKKDARI